MPEFTVFIPVFNEGAIVGPNSKRLLEYLDQFNSDYELIIGSNGSGDNTADEGQKLSQEYRQVRFFSLAQRGPGAAFARAVEMAAAPHIITMDMDLSVDLEFVPKALDKLSTYAVVVGSKFQGLQERTLTRIIASGTYIASARILLGLPYQDYSIGAKAFHRDVILRYSHLIDRHTAYVGNLIYAAHRAGLPICEVPVTCSDRRRSRFNLAYEGLYRLAWLLRLFGRYRLGGGQIEKS
jgi:glycosyltransferase involved in cell wall biosynthesis